MEHEHTAMEVPGAKKPRATRVTTQKASAASALRKEKVAASKAAAAVRKAEQDAILAKERAEAEALRKFKIAESKFAAFARKAHKRVNRYRIQDGVEETTFALGNSADPIIIDDEPVVFKKWKLFIKLPIEIRLKIFHLMFPPARQVPFWMQFIDDEVAPPITLHINQESRYETLRHYQILWPHDHPGFNYISPLIDRPLIIDTDKDTLVLKSITKRDLHEITFAHQLYNLKFFRTPLEKAKLEGPRLWVDYLDCALKGGLKSIKYIRAIQSGYTHLRDFKEGDAARGLQRFGGLKEVTLVHHSGAAADQELTLATATYQSYRDNIIGFEVPQIKVELEVSSNQVHAADNYGV